MIVDTVVSRTVVPRLLDTLSRSWEVGRLEVELPDGATHTFGPEDAHRRARPGMSRTRHPMAERRHLGWRQRPRSARQARSRFVTSARGYDALP